MDIIKYEELKEGLKEYNEKLGKPYGNEIVDYPPKNYASPNTIFIEVRNNATSFNSCFDRVASVGYRVEIYAKTKNKIDKQKIAREIAYYVDLFLTSKGLNRVSFNPNPNFNNSDGAIYGLIMMYEGSLHENRSKII